MTEYRRLRRPHLFNRLASLALLASDLALAQPLQAGLPMRHSPCAGNRVARAGLPPAVRRARVIPISRRLLFDSRFLAAKSASNRPDTPWSLALSASFRAALLDCYFEHSLRPASLRLPLQVRCFHLACSNCNASVNAASFILTRRRLASRVKQLPLSGPSPVGN